MSTEESKNLGEILKKDPLHIAEQITGKSYKEDKDTSVLGMGLHIAHTANKKQMLKNDKDSYMGMSYKLYIDLLEELGFKQILMVQFESQWNDRDKFFVFWRDDGILLKFDTFSGETVNGGSFFYNWKPNDIKEMGGATSSGGFDDCGHEDDHSKWVWYGNHDCREAIRFHIKQLEEFGSFVTPWEKIPFLWLCHHGDKDKNGKQDNYKEIGLERSQKLPKRVLDVIFANESMEEFWKER